MTAAAPLSTERLAELRDRIARNWTPARWFADLLSAHDHWQAEAERQRQRAEMFKRRCQRYEEALAKLPPNMWPEFATSEPKEPGPT